MPKIEFLSPELKVIAAVDVPEGGSLANICVENRSPISISCRYANCASCYVRVLAGDQHCEPPGRDELDLLAVLDGPPEGRLGCQVQVRRGPGLIQLVRAA